MHQLLGNTIRIFNIQDSCANKNYPWIGILVAVSVFVVRSTYLTIMRKSPVQVLFDQDIIFPNENITNFNLIRHNNQF